MATPLRRALVDADERVRVYTPYGELIPGMAYLVRRLLENTSQTSFLRQGFAEGESPEQLLRNPVDVGREEDAGAVSGAAEGVAGDDVLDTSPERIERISPMPPHAEEALTEDPMAYGGWGSGPEFGLPPYRNEPTFD